MIEHPVLTSARGGAYRIVLAQLAITTLMGILFWGIEGINMGVSALLGGVSCVIPSAYFAKRFFSRQGAQDVKRIVRAFYVGECIKLGMSALLVVVFVEFLPVSLLAFFTGFAAAQMGFWLTPWFNRGSVV